MSFDLKMKAILDMGYAMVRSSRRSEDGRRRPSSVEQSSSSGVTRDVLPRQQVDMTQKTLAQVCADVAESLVAGGALDATNQPDVSNMEQMIRTRVSDEHIKQLITNGDILPLAQSAYVAIVYPALISDLNALSKEVVSGFSGASGQGTSSSVEKPKLPSSWKKLYCEKAAYSTEELNALFKVKGSFYKQEDMHALVAACCQQVFRGTTKSRGARMQLCEGLLKLMKDQRLSSIEFEGTTYSSTFFQALATDLALSRLHSQANAENRVTFSRHLQSTLNSSGPEVTQFTLLGEVHPRRDLEFWLRNLKNDAAWLPPQTGNVLAKEWELAIKDKDERRIEQNVHRSAVQAYAIQVYDLLLSKVGKFPELGVRDAKKEIGAAFANRSNAALLKKGLDKVIDATYTASETGLNASAAKVLTVLWLYIRNHPDRAMRSLLKGALWSRFAEIGAGYVCPVGIVERMLDVPSGVDDSLNVFARRRQIQEDVIKIANQVYGLSQSAEGKVNTFQRRVRDELIVAQHLNEVEVMSEANKQLVAFYD